MAYSLLADIENIRTFAKSVDSLLGVVPQMITPMLGHDPVLQSSVAAALNQTTPSFQWIVRKTVPIMLCIAWEGFVEELKVVDAARYAANFPAGFEKYHTEDIREVFLLRNCIVHCMGKIDQGYLTQSLIKTFTVVGTPIDFNDVQLGTQFKLFGDAYSKITT
jgi:hypothetical protein